MWGSRQQSLAGLEGLPPGCLTPMACKVLLAIGSWPPFSPGGPLQGGCLNVLLAWKLASPTASESERERENDGETQDFYDLASEVSQGITIPSYWLRRSAPVSVGGD